MKPLVILCSLAGLLFSVNNLRADLRSLCYGGYQPGWNIFARHNRCQSPEEIRLQRFWHDYYDAMQRYYRMMSRVDWTAYYKNHGQQMPVNGPCGFQPIMMAPVVVSPGMNWAYPQYPPYSGGMPPY